MPDGQFESLRLELLRGGHPEVSDGCVGISEHAATASSASRGKAVLPRGVAFMSTSRKGATFRASVGD